MTPETRAVRRTISSTVAWSTAARISAVCLVTTAVLPFNRLSNGAVERNVCGDGVLQRRPGAFAVVRRRRMHVGTRFHLARWNDEVGFLADQSCPTLGDEQLSDRMAHIILKPWLEPVRFRVDVQGRELSYDFNPHRRDPRLWMSLRRVLYFNSAERDSPVTTGRQVRAE